MITSDILILSTMNGREVKELAVDSDINTQMFTDTGRRPDKKKFSKPAF